MVKREEGGVTKELKVEMTGEGNLPVQGTIHVNIRNTFPDPIRESTIHIEIDRREETKHLKIEATLPGNKLYVINIDYKANLRDMRHGEYSIAITTPERRRRIWQNISGTWDVADSNQAALSLTIAGKTYTARGKMSLRESDIILNSSDGDDIYLQWKFERTGDYRDYFLKVGREYGYLMFKLKGTYTRTNGNVEFGIKLGRLTRHEFHCTNTWTRSEEGSINASGTFNYAQYEGTHQFTYNRNPSQRTADFNFSLTSSDPRYSQVNFHGSYDFYNKFRFNLEVDVNGRISRIDINLADFNPRRSRNTIESHIPILGEYASFHLIVQHDFTNNDNRYFHAIASIANREAYIKANWKRSPHLETLEGTIDIKYQHLGEIHINGKWDVSDLSNANAEASYTRTRPQGDQVTGNLRWKRVRTANHLENELTVDSTSPILSHLRFFTNVDFTQGFNLQSGLEVNRNTINVNFNVGNNSVSFEVTTPFRGFESVTGVITYSLVGKNQSITLKYERGERKIDMSLVVNRRSKKRGDVEFNLTSPFEAFQEMKITASWNKRQATVEYMRNDVRISMTGTGRYEGNRSEFNFTFNAPDGQQIVLGGAYDVEDIINGQGTEPKTIASLQLQAEGMDLGFSLSGFRNQGRVYIEIDGHSSLLGIRTFHLKLNSELNAINRTGIFELTMNDFVFKNENHFERYEDGGFYIRSKIESSLTPLPALVLGVGYRDEERIITVGYGDNREITFSVKSDNHFEHGFSGFVDIPNFGYDGGMKYEVEYRFPNPNQLLVELEMELGETGQEVEAQFMYDSEGVQARLSSPFTGRHSVRARRSITSNTLDTEFGYNDYTVRIRGEVDDDDIRRGGVLEGEVFGHKFLLDYLFQTNDLDFWEGKLIMKTPFQGMENMGGVFTVSMRGNELITQGELLLPFSEVPKITLDLGIKLGRDTEGNVTLNVAGAEYIVRSKLVGGSNVQEYRGSVEIFTPFSTLSHVSLEGAITMESRSKFVAEFKLTEPYTTHRLEMEFEYDPNKVSFNASVDSVSYNGVNVGFTLEGLRDMHKKLNLQVNDNKLIAEYSMSESMFIFNVDTLYFNVPRQVSVNAQFSSLQNMGGSVTVVLGEIKHDINGEFDININRIKGAIHLTSTLIEGNRAVVFDLSIPDQSFKQITVDLSMTIPQTHVFHFEFRSRAGVQARVTLVTPTMENISAEFVLSGAAAEFSVQTPSETHKAKVSLRMTQKMPADYIGVVELESPFLGDAYKLSVLLNAGTMSKTVKAELQVGTIQHLLEGNVYMRNNGGGFSFTLETPFRNIEKAVLEVSVLMSDKIKVYATANMPGNENTFNSEFDVTKNAFMAEAKSPYIPTGLARAEATLFYVHRGDMKLNVVLRNAEDSISGNLIYKANGYNFMFKVEIATPIPNFQSINCLVKLNTEESRKFIFSLDYPITIRVNATFSNLPELITSNVKVTTSIQSWEYVEADLSVPLDKFAPRATLEIPNHKYGAEAEYKTHGYSNQASAKLFLDDEVHGGKINLRTKAPYELGYDIDLWKLNSRFHLRTDSSFFLPILNTAAL